MEVRAVSKNVSVSPKKLRPIINTVRGKPVQEALIVLQFL
ncbi:MAG: Ribosomal protein L22p/L17e, partial [Dehalococcoidia bacterium]|nr:Ribosomal protein L22p/L17e [Dehalococcoidia bacterium]